MTFLSAFWCAHFLHFYLSYYFSQTIPFCSFHCRLSLTYSSSLCGLLLSISEDPSECTFWEHIWRMRSKLVQDSVHPLLSHFLFQTFAALRVKRGYQNNGLLKRLHFGSRRWRTTHLPFLHAFHEVFHELLTELIKFLFIEYALESILWKRKANNRNGIYRETSFFYRDQDEEKICVCLYAIWALQFCVIPLRRDSVFFLIIAYANHFSERVLPEQLTSGRSGATMQSYKARNYFKILKMNGVTRVIFRMHSKHWSRVKLHHHWHKWLIHMYIPEENL